MNRLSRSAIGGVWPSSRRSFVYLLAVAWAVPASAKDSDEFNKAATEIAVKFGTGTVSALAKSMNPENLPQRPDADATGRAFNSAANTYLKEREQWNGAIDGVNTVLTNTIDASAAVVTYASGGSLAIPALIGRGIAQAGKDAFIGNERAKAENSLRTFLAQQRTAIEAQTGTTYEQMRSKTPAELQAILQSGSGLVALDSRIVDPHLKQLSYELTADILLNTSKTTLDQLEHQGAQITDLGARVSILATAVNALATDTKSQLAGQDQRLTGIESAMTDLQGHVQNIDNRLIGNEKSLGFVEDFVMDKMSAAQKVKALQGGFMGLRFQCDNGGTDCENAKLKGELIERFASQAKIDSLVDASKSAIGYASDVNRIAANLGVDTGDLGNGINYGAKAIDVFASAASGNYLGAIVSLTGMFGQSAPDPQFVYVQQQFSAIRQALGTVIDNQRKLSEQIIDLKTDMLKQFSAMDTRLDRIETAVEIVRSDVAAVYQSQVRPCYALYHTAFLDPGSIPDGFDRQTGSFDSLNNVSTFIQNNSTNIKGCDALVSSLVGSIVQGGTFGSILDANLNVNSTVAPEKQRAQAYRSAAIRLVKQFLADRKIPFWRAYEIAVNPAADVRSASERLDAPVISPCSGSSSGLRARNYMVLCRRLSSTNKIDLSEASNAVLSAELLGGHALNLSDWVAFFSSLIDFYKVGENGVPITADTLLSAARHGGNAPSAGERALQNAALLLDTSLASNSLGDGELAALAVLNAIEAKPEQDATKEAGRKGNLLDARMLMEEEETLRANVAMVLLKRDFRLERAVINGDRINPSPNAYGKALSFAETDLSSYRFAFLTDLFRGRQFSVTADGVIEVTLLESEGDRGPIRVRMPEPLSFTNGRLIYPLQISQLAAQRDRIGNIAAQYTLLKGLKTTEREGFIATIIRADFGTRRLVSAPDAQFK